jgi:hypothetical protein
VKSPATVRRKTQPLASYLVRVVQERVETVRVHYEVVELGSGERHRFNSLAALQRHLRKTSGEM